MYDFVNTPNIHTSVHKLFSRNPLRARSIRWFTTFEILGCPEWWSVPFAISHADAFRNTLILLHTFHTKYNWNTHITHFVYSDTATTPTKHRQPQKKKKKKMRNERKINCSNQFIYYYSACVAFGISRKSQRHSTICNNKFQSWLICEWKIRFYWNWVNCNARSASEWKMKKLYKWIEMYDFSLCVRCVCVDVNVITMMICTISCADANGGNDGKG